MANSVDAMPWAPSLVQSPAFLNGFPVAASNRFSCPPCWQAWPLTLLPPLAAPAGAAMTTLATKANAPMTTTQLRRCIEQTSLARTPRG